jgi:ABC-2 type transport system permease protein
VATLAFMARLLAGLPLALLWLSPLILLVVLTTAWFKRWAWVIIGVGLGLGSLLLKQVFGQPLLMQTITGLLHHAAHAMISGGDSGFKVTDAGTAFEALRGVPGWVLADFGTAVRDLASPLLLGGLVFAAACFALLVQWRQRGAGAAG